MYTPMAPLSTIIVAAFNRYKTIIGIVALSAVLVAIGVYMYTYVLVPAAKKRDEEDVSNNPDGQGGAGAGDKVAVVTFFHVDWCKFCTKAQPIWDRFSANMTGKKINGWVIQCTDVNLTDNNAKGGANLALKQKYGLKEYPTVQLNKNGKVIVFDADMNDTNLNDFINKMV